MRSGKEGGLEDGGRRPGVVGGEGVGEALGGVAEDGTSVVADDDEAPARGLTTAGAAAGQVGGKWPRGRKVATWQDVETTSRISRQTTSARSPTANTGASLALGRAIASAATSVRSRGATGH